MRSTGDTPTVTVQGSSAYAGVGGLPDLVRAAVALATDLDFDHSCDPRQGRLLSVLAGGYAGGRIGETGTGCGVGLAWMVGATDGETTLTSVEVDRARAAAARDLFAGHPNVRITQGDWSELRASGPFDLLVLDGGGKGKEPGDGPPLEPADGWLALGGTIVLDDFIPADHADAGQHDRARRYWLEHPALRSIELRLSPTLATIVGRRVA
jgi:predicted O-methyltransferase YrrM